MKELEHTAEETINESDQAGLKALCEPQEHPLLNVHLACVDLRVFWGSVLSNSVEELEAQGVDKTSHSTQGLKWPTGLTPESLIKRLNAMMNQLSSMSLPSKSINRLNAMVNNEKFWDKNKRCMFQIGEQQFEWWRVWIQRKGKEKQEELQLRLRTKGVISVRDTLLCSFEMSSQPPHSRWHLKKNNSGQSYNRK